MRKKIIIKGPLLSMSGYGVQSRFALDALKSREDIFDIYALNIPWGSTGFISTDDPERKYIDFLLGKTVSHVQGGGSFDMSLQVTIPGEFEPIAPFNVGYTAGAETSLVSPGWLQKINTMNRIITTSEHTKNGIISTVYNVNDRETGESKGDLAVAPPVEAVNYATRVTEAEPLDVDFTTPFNFLAVAQLCPRKNLENTIGWFVEEFRDENVGLVLKTNTAKNSLMDKNFTEAKLRAFLNSLGPRKCKVYYLHGDLTEGEMISLYCHKKIKAMVSLSHGEGFGLPLFEAAYNGLPIIAPAWSGHVDFLSVPVKNRLQPHYTVVTHQLDKIQPEAVWPGVLEAESQWCYPQKNSYRKALREVMSNYGSVKKRATKLKKHVLKNWDPEVIYKQFVDAMGVELLETKPEEEAIVFD